MISAGTGRSIEAAWTKLNELWLVYRRNPQALLLAEIIGLEDEIAEGRPSSWKEVRIKLDLLLDILPTPASNSLEREMIRTIRQAIIEVYEVGEDQAANVVLSCRRSTLEKI